MDRVLHEAQVRHERLAVGNLNSTLSKLVLLKIMHPGPPVDFENTANMLIDSTLVPYPSFLAPRDLSLVGADIYGVANAKTLGQIRKSATVLLGDLGPGEQTAHDTPASPQNEIMVIPGPERLRKS